MMYEARVLVGTATPPIVHRGSRVCRTRPVPPLPAIARLAGALIAFSLPVLGIAYADTLHRVGPSRTMQPAAPVIPAQEAAPLGTGERPAAIRLTVLGAAFGRVRP